MSKYTTELRYICEAVAGYRSSRGYNDVNNVISNCWVEIFDFDFPIFDEAYRSVLCRKILMHYYTREIGFETVGLWKLKLQTKMQEVMPYFNKLYESETFRFNPLYDVDYTREYDGSDGGESIDTVEHTGTVNDDASHTGTISDEADHTGTVVDDNEHTGTVTDDNQHTGTIGDSGTHGGTVADVYSSEGDNSSDGTKTDNSSEWNVYSDTPQGALTNVANDTYLTDARRITKNGTETTHNSGENSESGENTRTYNETETNTRTFNENNDNEREYNENIVNERTYNESNDSVKTFNEKNDNKRTYNEKNEGERNFTNTKEYVEHVAGKSGSGSYANMIMEYRKSLMNIDMLVIDSLNSLFMLVW